MNAARILVTGSTGFVGSHLVPWLTSRGAKVRVALRNPAELPPGIESAVIGDIAEPRNLSRALEDVSAVVHCAGVAHASHIIPDETYTRINHHATLDLARAAARAGVTRFVFMSSIRAQSGPVNDAVLTEQTPPAPTDAYGRSKLAAEIGLAQLLPSGSTMDWVALRPVLVYGIGVKGNMASLLSLSCSRWPMPLGLSGAKRSILAIDNLCSAIETVLNAGVELRRPLIVADLQALSAGQMIAAMRKGLERGAGLIPVLEHLFVRAASLMGKGEAAARLTGALEVSPQALMALGWKPASTSQEALGRLALLSLARDHLEPEHSSRQP